MKFISTRGKSPAVTAAEAIRRGLAPDGGLYVPDELPVFSASELEALYALPYAELSAAVLAVPARLFARRAAGLYEKSLCSL